MQEKKNIGGGLNLRGAREGEHRRFRSQGCRRRRIQGVKILGVQEIEKTGDSNLRGAGEEEHREFRSQGCRRRSNKGDSDLRGVGEGEYRGFRSQGCKI